MKDVKEMRKAQYLIGYEKIVLSFGWSGECEKHHSIMERKLRSRAWKTIDFSYGDVGLELGVRGTHLTSEWKFGGGIKEIWNSRGRSQSFVSQSTRA